MYEYICIYVYTVICPSHHIRNCVGACANVHYKEVRKTWYAKIKARVTDMSLRMQEAFMNTLVMVDGCLLMGVDEGVDGQLTAWDAVSGRIPILWTEAAMTDESVETHMTHF